VEMNMLQREEGNVGEEPEMTEEQHQHQH